MPQPLLNECTFLRWKFSSREEELSAKVMSPLNKLFVQNERAILADRILSLKFDPTKQQEFIQEDAALRGQLDYLSYLLAESDSAERELQQLVSQ